VTSTPPGRLRVLIVDDEAPARSLLREYLDGMGDVEVARECANGFEAVAATHELEPDLLLLDVQMPGLDGFEVLELLERPVAVVFTTAHDEFAVRAFEVHAVDYLLKPFSRERLGDAISRARNRAGVPAAALLAEARARRGPLATRLLVRDGPRVHVIPVDTLDWVEACDDYVLLHVGPAVHRKQQTLAEVEASLDPRRFARIHRSFVLNLDRLARIELYAKDSRRAVLRDGTRLPLSRSGYARLRGDHARTG
jgi:two-component system LytT family response regulator